MRRLRQREREDCYAKDQHPDRSRTPKPGAARRIGGRLRRGGFLGPSDETCCHATDPPFGDRRCQWRSGREDGLRSRARLFCDEDQPGFLRQSQAGAAKPQRFDGGVQREDGLGRSASAGQRLPDRRAHRCGRCCGRQMACAGGCLSCRYCRLGPAGPPPAQSPELGPADRDGEPLGARYREGRGLRR